MTDLEMWSAIVAFFLPLVIAVAQQPRMNGVTRVFIMILFCILASVVTTALQGDLDWHRWFHSLMVLTIATIAFYRGVWRPSDIAPGIERRTSAGAAKVSHTP